MLRVQTTAGRLEWAADNVRPFLDQVKTRVAVEKVLRGGGGGGA